MDAKIKRIFCLLIVIIILISFLVQILLIPPADIETNDPVETNNYNTNNLYDDLEENEPEQESEHITKIMPVKVTSSMSISQGSNSNSRGPVDQKISKRTVIIDEDDEDLNVSILEDGVLKILDCEYTINGLLRVEKNGKLIIKNSTVTISPPALDEETIVIEFTDNAEISIENSNIFTYPQPSKTNISYLLSEDSVNVTVNGSYLNFKIPKVLHMDVRLSPANAGVFVITGNSIWDVNFSKIEGILLIEDNTLLSRWFLFTLLQNGQFIMTNSSGSVNDDSQPFIKPVAGYTKIENTSITQGVVDAEVSAEVDIIDVIIEDINIRDQVTARISGSKIGSTVDVGGLALVPSGSGEILPSQVTNVLPKTSVYIEDSNIGFKLIAQGNSSTRLVNCTIDRCSLFAEPFVYWENCNIQTMVDTAGKCNLFFEGSMLTSINIGDSCNVTFYKNKRAISKITTNFNSQSTINMYSNEIYNFEVFPGDSIPPEEYGPGYDPDKNVSKIILNMFDSNINLMKIEDDAQLFITLQNSEIGEFTFKKFKNENVLISIVDLGNNNFTMPDPWPDVNIEIVIHHKLNLAAFANSEGVEAYFEAMNDNVNQFISTQANGQGLAELNLINKKYTSSTPIVAGEITIKATYLGFSKEFKIKGEINENILIEWEDFTEPVDFDIDIDTSYQYTKRGTRIRAVVIDDGVKSIANATLYYQYKDEDGWTTWIPKTMVEIENYTFEAEIEQLPQGTEVRFFIIAYDFLGNRARSEKKTYTIPNTDEIFNLVVVSLSIIIIILISVFFMKRRRKLKKYLKTPPTSETRVKNELPHR